MAPARVIQIASSAALEVLSYLFPVSQGLAENSLRSKKQHQDQDRERNYIFERGVNERDSYTLNDTQKQAPDHRPFYIADAA